MKKIIEGKWLGCAWSSISCLTPFLQEDSVDAVRRAWELLGGSVVVVQLDVYVR